MACLILQKQEEQIRREGGVTIPGERMKQLRERETTTNSTTGDNMIGPQADSSTPSNLCVLCVEEEKRLACIPCGHLATCVPCGHLLRTCPICQRDIEAFVRIYN